MRIVLVEPGWTVRRPHSDPLGWEEDGNSYSALLPFIPGYPAGYNTVTVELASASGDDKLESDEGWWFMMFIHTNDDGDVLPVSPVDFGIEDTFPTAEDTMRFIEEHLSPESVSQVLEDMDFAPILDDNGDWSMETARKHATRRQADVDLDPDLEDLGLDWKQDGPWEGEYMTTLPAIPGYTQPDDPYNIAEVYPVDPENPYEGFDFHIYASTPNGEINMYSSDFGLPLSENAGDAMATVGDIPIGSLIEAFEDEGVEPTSATASRHARYTARHCNQNRWY